MPGTSSKALANYNPPYSCPDKEHSLKQFGVGELTTDNPPLREVKAGAQGRVLEAGTQAEATEGCCVLACSPLLAQFAF